MLTVIELNDFKSAISWQRSMPCRGGIMYRKLILIATFIVLVTMSVLAHRHEVQSATSRVGWPPARMVKFVASTEKNFAQLMGDAMSVMDWSMHNAEYSGDTDHDFVTMMIPHHQGAIDMAKALLLYGKDPQMRGLAQEIVTEQQSEIQLMQLWLKQHGAKSQNSTLRPLDARKN
jgi:uncharacterized protein (DUF305 family)